MPTVTDSQPWVSALRASHDKLAGLVAGLDADGLRQRSYAKEWSIADVLSHLGSGAEIALLSLEAGLARTDPPTAEDFQPIWAAWNARPPEEQAARCLTADDILVSRLELMSEAQREAFSVLMFGAMTMDLAGFLGLRLSEHAAHTWDIAVALDPDATIEPDAVALMVDALPLFAGFSAKAAAESVVVAVTATDPDRSFALDTGGVTLVPGDPGDAATASVVAPAEVVIRLVYGRVDDDSELTAAGVTVPELRAVFPGF